jgi:hypothetical protein
VQKKESIGDDWSSLRKRRLLHDLCAWQRLIQKQFRKTNPDADFHSDSIIEGQPLVG